MGALLGAPRTLQALARDAVVPRIFGRGYGRNNDPRLAIIVAFGIALAGILLGDLNAIAPLLSMFFLTSYGVLNFSAAVEGLIGSPAWRFRLDDDDYFNPWLGTRFVAVWMNGLIDSLGGDLDAAVRAYHRGAVRARRGEGGSYLETVKQRRRFLRGDGRSAAWTFLTSKAAELAGPARPWLSHASPDRIVAVESQVVEARVLEPAYLDASVPEALAGSRASRPSAFGLPK